jgi:hypothetical protein
MHDFWLLLLPVVRFGLQRPELVLLEVFGQRWRLMQEYDRTWGKTGHHGAGVSYTTKGCFFFCFRGLCARMRSRSLSTQPLAGLNAILGLINMS